MPRGLDAIGAYYRDICGRNIDHEVRDAVSTPDGLAFTSTAATRTAPACVCVTVATVSRTARSAGQTAVQAWDS